MTHSDAFPRARNDWNCLGQRRRSTLSDCHADNCDCLFFDGSSFLFTPPLIANGCNFCHRIHSVVARSNSAEYYKSDRVTAVGIRGAQIISKPLQLLNRL